MTEGNSLINLGGISKPATVLIEKISDAFGGYFKPRQITRVAKAEAAAKIIGAEAQIQVDDLQHRARNRLMAEESIKQENIEAITGEAIPQLEENSKPEEMEEDWITNFFDNCRIASDKEMQSLWAKVLSGEANKPGSFSRRTVNFLNSLDTSEARLFTDLCGFGWNVGEIIPLIYDPHDSIYDDRGITFKTLTHLNDIGLISFNPVTGYERPDVPKYGAVDYYGQRITIEFPAKEKNILDLGKVLLTNVGQQLAPICGSKPVEGFKEYVIDHWAKQGLVCNPASSVSN